MKSLSFLAELNLWIKEHFYIDLTQTGFEQQSKCEKREDRCSLSTDDVHGEPQGLLHAVGLTLVGPRHDTVELYQSMRTVQSKMISRCAYLRQLDGFTELVQGALQVRQLVETEEHSSKKTRETTSKCRIFHCPSFT